MANLDDHARGEALPGNAKSPSNFDMVKQVQKKTDGRTIIFYSFKESIKESGAADKSETDPTGAKRRELI